MLKICPDCKGELEKGSTIDHVYTAVLPGYYAQNENAGVPNLGFKFNFKNVREIIAFRCKSCNRIFSYAAPNLITARKTPFILWILLILFLIVIISTVSVAIVVSISH